MKNLLLKRLLSFLSLLIIVVSSLLIFFPKLVSTAQAQTPTPRPLKYFGADVVNVGDIATLASLNMNTATVVLSAYGGEGAWAPYLNAAKQHKVGLVIWPTGGGGNCGFPYNGTDISAIHSMLDYFGDEDMFYGIVNAHEPSWSCPMSVSEMILIRQKIKDYVRNKYGREIKVWNYIDNITSFVTSGDIMDIAMTWDYCFALPGYSCEKPCATTQQIIVNDRNTIDSSGWNHVDLVHLFHTFELTGYYGCRMPTADELYQWSCSFLNTNALDGLLYYTWQNPASYTQTLAGSPDLWPAVQRVYNDCVNKDGVSTPTPTPTTGSSPTPTSTPPPKDPDLDNNNQVNVQDMRQLLAAWGPIASTADEDLDSNGKVNSLDAGRIIANWTGSPPASPTPTSTPPPNVTPTPTPTPGSPPPPGEFLYGVDLIGPPAGSDYSELAGYGANIVMAFLHPASSSWQSSLAAAEAAGIKLIIWPSGGCLDSSGVPWCWTGAIGGRWDSPDSWNLSGGIEALRWAQKYVTGQTDLRGDALLAVLSIHEPFWSSGLDSDHADDQIRGLYQAMKREAPNVGIFAYTGALAFWDKNYGGSGYAKYSITDGMWDWAGIWLHFFGGVEGTREQAKQRIRDDRSLIENKGLNMKLLFAIQTFAMGGGYRMPSKSELSSFTCEIVREGLLDAVTYYGWYGYSDNLSSHYRGNRELKGVIEEVCRDCVPNCRFP